MADESTRTWLWRSVVQGVFFALLVSGVGVVLTAKVTEVMAPPTCADTKDLVRIERPAASATSVHPPERDSQGRVLTYLPDRVLDGDTATGWAEGAPDLGQGQALVFDFPQPVSLSMLCVVNGYAQSWALYTKNARVRALAVVALEQHGSVSTAGQPPSQSATPLPLPSPSDASTIRYVTLSDAGSPDHVAQFQSESVDLPPVRRLALRIESVYSGTTVGRLADTSLSEIEFWGPP